VVGAWWSILPRFDAGLPPAEMGGGVRVPLYSVKHGDAMPMGVWRVLRTLNRPPLVTGVRHVHAGPARWEVIANPAGPATYYPLAPCGTAPGTPSFHTVHPAGATDLLACQSPKSSL
jgi:hypothetical protein